MIKGGPVLKSFAHFHGREVAAGEVPVSEVPHGRGAVLSKVRIGEVSVSRVAVATGNTPAGRIVPMGLSEVPVKNS